MKRSLSPQNKAECSPSKKSREKRLYHQNFGLFLFRETSLHTKSKLIGKKINFENDKIEFISKFLTRHEAIKVLVPSSAISNEDENEKPENKIESNSMKNSYDDMIPAVEMQNYLKECLTFYDEQFHKIASAHINPFLLTPSKNDSEINLIRSVFESIIMKHADKRELDLQNKDLKQFHTSLLKALRYNTEQLSTDPIGKDEKKSLWRTTYVKDACPYDNIQIQMFHLLKGIKALQEGKKIDRDTRNTSDISQNLLRQSQSLFRALSIASVLVYGIFVIQPFSNSNENIALTCINWVVRRYTSIPFPVHFSFFSQSETNGDIFVCIEQIRSNIATYNQKKLSSKMKLSSKKPFIFIIFKPLMQMILDQIYTQVNHLIDHLSTKFQSFHRQRIDKALRKKRENSIMDGTCVICLSKNPNIATLCCGNAVHFNCLAEWLKRKGNCMVCRKELPMLQLRDDEDEDEDEEGEEESIVSESDRYYNFRGFGDDEESHDATSDSSEYISSDDDSLCGRGFLCRCDRCDDDQDYSMSSSSSSEASEDMFSTASAVGSSLSPLVLRNTDFQHYEVPHQLFINLDTESQGDTSERLSSRRMLICVGRNCSNTAAMDCTNGCCARCCGAHLSFCERHQNK